MSTNDNKVDKLNQVADHTLTILAARFMIVVGIPAMVAISGWSLATTMDIQVRLGKLEQKSADSGHDQYHGADATRDFALRDYRIQTNTESFHTIDGRVSFIERNAIFKNFPSTP